MKLKAALFDLDGTLMDSEWYYTQFWTDIAKEMLPHVPNLGLLARGVSPTATLARFFPDDNDKAEILRRMKICDDNLPCTMYDGALEFVRHLRSKGLKCAVVTSSMTPKMEIIYGRVPDFKPSFDLILTAEEFGRPKPAPDCYLKAAEKLGCIQDECIVFEDSDSGLKSAMSAGMFTFGLTTGSTPEELKDKCDYVLDGFKNLDYSKVVDIIKAAKVVSRH